MRACMCASVHACEHTSVHVHARVYRNAWQGMAGCSLLHAAPSGYRTSAMCTDMCIHMYMDMYIDMNMDVTHQKGPDGHQSAVRLFLGKPFSF